MIYYVIMSLRIYWQLFYHHWSLCVYSFLFQLTMIKKRLREKERKELLFLEPLLGHVVYCSLHPLSLSLSSLVIVCILIIFCSYHFSFCFLKRDNYYSKTSIIKPIRRCGNPRVWLTRQDILKHQAATNNTTIIYSTLETFLYSKTHTHTLSEGTCKHTHSSYHHNLNTSPHR